MRLRFALLSMALASGATFSAVDGMAGTCPGGPAPSGAAVHGPVLEIPDASSLCVALGESPSTWVTVRLAHPSHTYPLLMAAAFGKNAVCFVGRDGLGICDIEDQPLDLELRRPETIEASLSWR